MHGTVGIFALPGEEDVNPDPKDIRGCGGRIKCSSGIKETRL